MIATVIKIGFLYFAKCGDEFISYGTTEDEARIFAYKYNKAHGLI